MRRLAFAGLLLGLATLSSLTSAAAAPPVVAPKPDDDQAVLRRIFADWAARRERFSSVRHSLEGKMFRPKGYLNDLRVDLFEPDEMPAGNVPPKDLRYRTSALVAIDFKRGVARIERRSADFTPPASVLPTYEVRLFDGEWKQRFEPQEQNPDVRAGVLEPEMTQGKLMPVYRDGFFDRALRPLLYGHGFVPGSTDAEVLREPADHSRLHGVGHVEHDGRRCVVLRTRPVEEHALVQEFLVDVERDSAVVRTALRHAAEERRVATITYRETPDGWMPDRWTDEVTGLSRETLKVVTTERNPDLSSERFRMEPSLGMIFKQGGKLWIHRGKDLPPLDARKHFKPGTPKDL
ncbi:MAG: hypothetical protein WBC44_22660 [Planctomycetaceae bacterium]